MTTCSSISGDACAARSCSLTRIADARRCATVARFCLVVVRRLCAEACGERPPSDRFPTCGDGDALALEGRRPDAAEFDGRRPVRDACDVDRRRPVLVLPCAAVGGVTPELLARRAM